jgi:tetratricopeptide (TPR) repeat protein
MSSTWLPVLVVLGFGLITGLIAAWRLRAETGLSSEAADRALQLADLKRRRDSLYRQIRSSEGGADRDRLELSAAFVLRQIDELTGGSAPTMDDVGTPAGQMEPAAAAPSVPPAASQPDRKPGRPMLVGFLGGAAMVALVGALIYWAVRDAKPRPGMPGDAAMSLPAREHPDVDLPPEVRVEIEGLRQQLAANPGDVLARKRLALALLSAESFVEAFELAEGILGLNPDDPDGLYIQGMVRLTMGQNEAAMEQLNRVLEQYPNHVMALAGRGMIFFRQGDAEAARLVWQRALDAAGGRHPDIEQLLAMTEGAAGALPANHPPLGESVEEGLGGRQAEAAAAPSLPPAGPVAADSYSIDVQIAAGANVPPTATLFVFLRESGEGPPAAVKRIQSPSFPLRVTLGPGDTMLGRPLPPSGRITIRLDADGSASTRSEGDLMLEIESQAGTSASVVLGQ